MLEIVRFFGRLFCNILLLVFLSIPLELVGAILLIIPCLIQGNSLKPLPRCLRWFDNADQFVGRDTSTYMSVYKSGRLNRYLWLAFRNPCNYFGYQVLGIYIDNIILQVKEVGDIKVGDGVGQNPGFFYQEVKIDDKMYYEYYFVKPFGNGKCFRFRMGYKIGQISKATLNQRVERVFAVQPYKDYSGT